MKVDEAVAMAARAAMRGCEDGVDAGEWASFAEAAVEAAVEAGKAMRAARTAAERAAEGKKVAPAELQRLRQEAFLANLQFATAALMTLAHSELDGFDWPPDSLAPELFS